MVHPGQSLPLFSEGEIPEGVEPYIAKQKEKLRSIGGRYISGYISTEEENEFLDRIKEAESQWLSVLKRRVQHYGYRYDYKARKISEDMRIGKLPEWVVPFVERLVEDFFHERPPEQMIINEYKPGQGIAPHVDCEPCFGPVVVSISIGSTCMMGLERRAVSSEKVRQVPASDREGIELFLEPRSAVVLAGDSRYLWTHGIAPRKNDIIGHRKYPRERRVSLTFRSVVLQQDA
ncbi:MAG: alpha-ketoglutarate-dependent dioxygenase AlkB [Gammaproteobacteria bacterium]|nr:alpha-ketoglutarate-dependent dioxygenase AlkB [Gammaproteobacteria bacterium]